MTPKKSPPPKPNIIRKDMYAKKKKTRKVSHSIMGLPISAFNGIWGGKIGCNKCGAPHFEPVSGGSLLVTNLRLTAPKKKK